nr:hypothetical protein Iba_chr15aCG2020 [Ipomoea batatas]GMD97386.1 hypothetical protein Iba_chr15cCG2110 [Ipomoea batatas]
MTTCTCLHPPHTPAAIQVFQQVLPIGIVTANIPKKGTLTSQMDVKTMVSSLSSNYQLLLVLVQVLDFC